MKFIWGLAAIMAAGPFRAVAATDDFQIWTSLNIGGNLSDKVVANMEVASRFDRDASHLNVLVARPTIGYRLSDAVVVHIGYAFQKTIVDGRADVNENRFFQQTNWRVGKIGRATLASRTRIELRTVEGRNDTGWRLRQRLQLQIPTRTKGVNVIVSSEALFALNSTDWGARAGFDQMRNFVGVSLPLSKALTLETGYQHRYQRRVGQADRSDHIVPVTISVRL